MAVQLLSEKLSAEFAGVNTETIRQYSRIGLLHPAAGQEQTVYAVSDLRRVFQIAESKAAPEADGELAAQAAEPAPGPIKSAAGVEPVEKSPPRAADAVSYSHPGMNNSYEVLEISRSLREQIQILRDERDWLRKRVEALESRVERDQMLILSETKNVRQLIAAAPRQRSGFWSLLPWNRPDLASHKR